MKRLNETGTPVEKMLLLSGKDDAPAPGARERAMLSMGLSDAPPAGKAQGISSGIKIIQWIGQILLYGALAALSGALIFSDNTIDSNPKENINNSGVEQSIDNGSNAIKTAESENAAAPKPEPSGESAPPNAQNIPNTPNTQNTQNTQNTSKILPPKPAPPKTPNSALKEEIELVDAARKALRNDKNPGAALKALERYQSRFPKGVLRGEAQTLLRELKNSPPQPPD